MAKTVEAKLSLEEELDQLKDAKESLEVSEKEVSRLSAKLEEKEQRLDESLGITTVIHLYYELIMKSI